MEPFGFDWFASQAVSCQRATFASDDNSAIDLVMFGTGFQQMYLMATEPSLALMTHQEVISHRQAVLLLLLMMIKQCG